ncbi:Transcription enhancer factor-like protein egl-44 [Frankliniella fusca]|uniref:Transcription enhancer factor-like protein egl-44 n=1 Tax=Frankliniella fusca TaxID=407009 RepID=A0AAE1L9D8_9NEOP|nr:Transcription enhancer factor-like protein egl-44 [Frankliniella fusca]
MVHTVLQKNRFTKKMDPARDYTVKSTRNWSSFQLFSTPSSGTSPEASFRVQFDGAHRFSIKKDPTRDYTVKSTQN